MSADGKQTVENSGKNRKILVSPCKRQIERRTASTATVRRAQKYGDTPTGIERRTDNGKNEVTGKFC